MQTYCDFFQTLHDETSPVGYLGRGTHCSVLRAVVFHDPLGNPLSEGRFADFAVIWDEDHDVRVMEPIQEIYRRGLLPSFVMFGEHKGSFTAIPSPKITSVVGAISASYNPALLTKVDDLELSVRTANCLKNDYVVYTGDLVQKTEDEMLRVPNFGRKSLYEIKEVLVQMGLHLGMKVPSWWPPENIDELSSINRRFRLLQVQINKICQSLTDPWTSSVVALGSEDNPIIPDENKKVGLYLENLKMLWELGMVSNNRLLLARLADKVKRPEMLTVPSTA